LAGTPGVAGVLSAPTAAEFCEPEVLYVPSRSRIAAPANDGAATAARFIDTFLPLVPRRR
jgi:hypothetical protein